MAEWSKAAALKPAKRNSFQGSNPCPSADIPDLSRWEDEGGATNLDREPEVLTESDDPDTLKA